MATKKTTKARFSDPDMKHFGDEPLFDPSLGTEWDGRAAATMRALNWYNYFVSKKDLVQDQVDYARDQLKLTKDQISAFKAAANTWSSSTIGALIRMSERGYVLDAKQKSSIQQSILDTIKIGQKAPKSDEVEETKSTAPVITIQDRVRLKVHATIIEDVREIEDKWMAGEKVTDFDAYKAMQTHGLPAMACSYAIPWVSGLHDEYNDALNKTCDQAVEAYKHLSKVDLKNRVKLLNKILDDLKRYQTNSKTVRKTRTKKPVAATKQVAKIKFLKESPEFKLVSINPASVVGAMRLFVFNVKTRTLSEYVSSGPSGLAVKGTTLQGWDETTSRSKKLRKPEDILPIVLSKTARQIGNAWKTLTTKDASPNGRLNEDTILMRTLNG